MYENFIAKILFIIGVAQITIGIFAGILIGSNYESWAIFFIWSIGGFILGMLFIGFAENIQLLQRIYMKMTEEEVLQDNDVIVEEVKESEPVESDGWYLPEDREKIEHYYKNETIIEIAPSPIEGYCIVKLAYASNEFVRVVDIHGFGLKEVQDEDIKSSVISWYNNME
ncbi:hypothetical protein [Virgibacillus necropolis]|uniref:Uncharacterized protein n=1 Tax=Virgibacillus necropolis TaxID=163877 RepID=A0A221MGM8_9BACI|nr:hypothetical protein [Virgibacillus necropolis]ASN06807.1 hypothetical protein CFK40_18165 [Virgibacillus necropolis]